jgi:hypothetical protein
MRGIYYAIQGALGGLYAGMAIGFHQPILICVTALALFYIVLDLRADATR